MESFPGNEKHSPSGTIVFANKYNLEAYHVRSTIVVTRQIHFLGTMPTALNGYPGTNSTLQFPPHTHGFRFIAKSHGLAAVGSRLSHLRILGSGGLKAIGEGIGVQSLRHDRDRRLFDLELV